MKTITFFSRMNNKTTIKIRALNANQGKDHEIYAFS